MKYLTFLIFLLIGQVSWTQSIYGSVSGGYQRITQSSQPPSYIVNSYHQITDPWFWRSEDLSFSDALRTDLSFGHLLTEHLGYELSGSYFKPFTVIDDNGYTNRQFSGRFFQASFKILISAKIKRFDIYTKLGLNYSTGRLFYDQKMYNKGTLPLGFDESILKYEYTEGSKLGYNISLGVSFDISDRLFVFSEIYSIYQPFEPGKGQITEQTYDGENVMHYVEDPYFSEIQFGDESESNYYYSDDKSQPQKLYKRNYSLGGIGVNLGIKFLLWSK